MLTNQNITPFFSLGRMIEPSRSFSLAATKSNIAFSSLAYQNSKSQQVEKVKCDTFPLPEDPAAITPANTTSIHFNTLQQTLVPLAKVAPSFLDASNSEWILNPSFHTTRSFVGRSFTGNDIVAGETSVCLDVEAHSWSNGGSSRRPYSLCNVQLYRPNDSKGRRSLCPTTEQTRQRHHRQWHPSTRQLGHCT
jgi:hypothetical protein